MYIHIYIYIYVYTYVQTHTCIYIHTGSEDLTASVVSNAWVTYEMGATQQVFLFFLCCTVFHFFALFWTVLQSVAACFSVLQQCVAVAKTHRITCLLRSLSASPPLIMGLFCKSDLRRQGLLLCLGHCNTLQHTATHCNTLQHTATHCNTLQRTASHGITLQHTETQCNTCEHTAAHCNTLQHTTTHCNTLQHIATHCSTLQHTASSVSSPPLQHTASPYHAATHCNLPGPIRDLCSLPDFQISGNYFTYRSVQIKKMFWRIKRSRI